MSKTVKIQQAKTHLSAILHEVEQGEDYVIARGDTAVARLIPIGDPPERDWGFVTYDVPADFDNFLPAEELAAWE